MKKSFVLVPIESTHLSRHVVYSTIGTYLIIMGFLFHIFVQKFPQDLPPSTYVNPENKQEILARSEIERRGKYIDLMESRSPLLNVPLLIKQCLHNDPQQRPSTEEVLTRLQAMKAEVEGDYGGDFIKVDIGKMKIIKKLREKDKKIEEQVGMEALFLNQ